MINSYAKNHALPSSIFTWIGKVGGIEDSDCRFKYYQLYDDACDLGFWVESTRTGEKVMFVHAEDVREKKYANEFRNGGDVIYSKFVSIGQVGPQIEIRVYND